MPETTNKLTVGIALNFLNGQLSIVGVVVHKSEMTESLSLTDLFRSISKLSEDQVILMFVSSVLLRFWHKLFRHSFPLMEILSLKIAVLVYLWHFIFFQNLLHEGLFRCEKRLTG